MGHSEVAHAHIHDDRYDLVENVVLLVPAGPR